MVGLKINLLPEIYANMQRHADWSTELLALSSPLDTRFSKRHKLSPANFQTANTHTPIPVSVIEKIVKKMNGLLDPSLVVSPEQSTVCVGYIWTLWIVYFMYRLYMNPLICMHTGCQVAVPIPILHLGRFKESRTSQPFRHPHCNLPQWSQESDGLGRQVGMFI